MVEIQKLLLIFQIFFAFDREAWHYIELAGCRISWKWHKRSHTKPQKLRNLQLFFPKFCVSLNLRGVWGEENFNKIMVFEASRDWAAQRVQVFNLPQRPGSTNLHHTTGRTKVLASWTLNFFKKYLFEKLFKNLKNWL